MKFDRRMYFLENDRRYCRTYLDNNLDASLQKELSFYQQKAKEWAEVQKMDFVSCLSLLLRSYQGDYNNHIIIL